jgi:hypothetical protein
MPDIDTSLLGQMAAEVMGELEAQYDADKFKIRTVAIVVEMDSPETGSFVVRCSDDRPWSQRAFLDEAIEMIDRRRELEWQRIRDQDDDS